MNKQFTGKVIVAALWCWTMVYCSSASHQTEPTAVPLTKCCNDSEFYNTGFDKCHAWNIIPEPELFPPIYSYDNNNTIKRISRDGFALSTTNNLTSCPPGSVIKSWTEFQIYQDGKLKTLDRQEERDSGEFCIERTLSESEIPVFVARFCVEDPCAGNETLCVRKCCPNGMVLNETGRVCQSSSVPFVVPFRNESGTRVESHPALITRDGVFPICENGAYPLEPSEYKDDEFYVLPDGRIHIPSFRQHDEATRDDYCIDHFTWKEDKLVLHALICFPAAPKKLEEDTFVLSFYPYFLLVSSLFLIITFVVYALLPALRNIHGVTLMCQIASMTVMYIGLATIQLFNELHDNLCVGLAVIVHFAFLSTFTWLNVMSFDLWWELRDMGPKRPKHDRLGRRFGYYSLYAWTIPILIVGFGQVVHNVKGLSKYLIQPGFGIQSCWFSSRWSFITYLYGPMALLILANMFFFFTTAISLCRMGNSHSQNNATLHFKKKKFRFIFILFVLMGMSWMTEVVSFAVGGSRYLWIPTDVLNILTGVFIFVIFVCNANVWSLLKNKYPILKEIDGICPSCMKYERTRDEDESISNALQQTAI